MPKKYPFFYNHYKIRLIKELKLKLNKKSCCIRKDTKDITWVGWD